MLCNLLNSSSKKFKDLVSFVCSTTSEGTDKTEREDVENRQYLKEWEDIVATKDVNLTDLSLLLYEVNSTSVELELELVIGNDFSVIDYIESEGYRENNKGNQLSIYRSDEDDLKTLVAMTEVPTTNLYNVDIKVTNIVGPFEGYKNSGNIFSDSLMGIGIQFPILEGVTTLIGELFPTGNNLTSEGDIELTITTWNPEPYSVTSDRYGYTPFTNTVITVSGDGYIGSYEFTGGYKSDRIEYFGY